MPRASDSPAYRASDYQAPTTWASDPAGPDAWASDPDGRLEEGWPAPTERATDSYPHPATDPAPEPDAQAWGATDPIRSLTRTIGLAAALEAFCAGKAAEGLSPRSIVWYRMIGQRLVGRFGAERPVDTLTPTELRTWLVELRATLSPMSVAGYVRGLRAFGNWLARDGLAVARALRALANSVHDFQSPPDRAREAAANAPLQLSAIFGLAACLPLKDALDQIHDERTVD